MTRARVTVSPVNSILLILDKDSGTLPAALSGALVAATESCIVVGTRSALDGPTTVTLSNRRESGLGGLSLAYRGTLSTPDCEMHVCTAVLECVATEKVRGLRTPIEVWVHDAKEPDDIWILFDAATLSP